MKSDLTARQMLDLRDALARAFGQAVAGPRHWLKTGYLVDTEQRALQSLAGLPEMEALTTLITLAELAKRARDADVVAWTPEVYRAAIRGADAFAGTPAVPVVYQERNELWLFTEPGVYDNDPAGPVVEVGKLLTWLSVADPLSPLHIASLMVTSLRLPAPEYTPHTWAGRLAHESPLLRGICFYDMRYDRLPGADALPDVWQVYAAMEWMRLPLVRHAVLMPRPDRRRYERETGRRAPTLTAPAWDEDSIRTVYLRKPLPGEATGAGEYDGSEERRRGADFRYRVDGHWRHYRKYNQGRPRYIEPYLKGNPDSPVRESKRIFRVRE